MNRDSLQFDFKKVHLSRCIFGLDDAAGAYALTGLATAGTSFLGNLIGMRNQNKANQTNIQLQREQNAWNEKMWNLNNEYNTPVNQVQRLKDAGLNVGLMYSNGQGDVGNSSSLANTTAPARVDSLGNPMTGVTDSISQIMNTLILAQKADSEIAKNYADAGLSEESRKYKMYERQHLLPEQANLLLNNNKKVVAETGIIDLQKRTFMQNFMSILNLRSEKAFEAGTNGLLNGAKLDYQKKVNDAFDRLNEATIYNLMSQGDLNVALANVNDFVAEIKDYTAQILSRFGVPKADAEVNALLANILKNMNIKIGNDGTLSILGVDGSYKNITYKEGFSEFEKLRELLVPINRQDLYKRTYSTRRKAKRPY